MNVTMFYDPEFEYFDFDGSDNWIQRPIGEAFLDFVELECFRDFKTMSDNDYDKSPYFILFDNKDDLVKNIDNIINVNADYKAATQFVLSSDIDEFKGLDAATRFYLLSEHAYPEIVKIEIPTTFTWVRLSKGNAPDKSKINYSNDSLCSETYKGLADSVNGCVFKTFETYHATSIREALHISFMKMVSNDVLVKKCKCCGKYFIPRGRPDAEYCDRIAPDSKKTCSEIGAIKRYKEKCTNNPILRAFQKEYKKQNARVRTKKISQDQFFTWSENARSLRDEAVKNDMDIESFEPLLNKLGDELNGNNSEAR